MKKYMTFVFDDGPREPLCDIVDLFKKYGFRAGFAVIGESISDSNEYMLSYAVDNGFQLVSHSQTHQHLERLSREEIRYELEAPVKEIKRRIGYDVTMARLPFISYNDDVLDVARELCLPLLGQGIDGGRDWANDVTAGSVADAILSSACDGAVGCLHVKPHTLEALQIAIPKLKDLGCVLLTPAELLKIRGINPAPLGVNINNVNDFV